MEDKKGMYEFLIHGQYQTKKYNCECMDFNNLNIDIENDTTALVKLKDSNKPWVMYQINKDGMYYSFDNRFERIYFIDNDKLSEYEIEIFK